MRGRTLPGYMTIEAVGVFVTVLSLISFVVSVGIYKYEKCNFELESYYELQKGVQIGEETEDYVHVEGRRGIVQRQKQINIFMGVFGKEEILLSVKTKMEKPEPVLALRFSQRMMKEQEDEYRKTRSATVETGNE